ncbi:MULTISPECIES: roadblock/LC7 domain-containing protein [unclassified Nocardiopsis]|uniref:roadblock/LC7 domain-containing protein n=1 Tax=unclassified Nocardiopsis TaxID=2649073 RepID=UPI00210804E5|nr:MULTISPECIES: roadblock/LC7 domain-containing protein [unclassified Nocardiopsis]
MTTTATRAEPTSPRLESDTACSSSAVPARALVQTLVDLVSSTQAEAGVVFGRDGLYLARTGMDQVRAERTAAALSSLRQLASGIARQQRRGTVETILVRYQHGAVVVTPITYGAAAALVVGEAVSVQEAARALSLFAEAAEGLLPPPQSPFVSRTAETGARV